MKRVTTEGFIKKARLIHGNKYNYSLSEYKKAKLKIIIICPIHGNFLQTPNDHLNGRGCKNCGIIKRSKNKRISKEEFFERAAKTHGQRYIYNYHNDYKDLFTKTGIICRKHGVFYQIPNDHIRGKNCYKCSLITRKRKKKHSLERFIKKSHEIHQNKFDYSKTVYKHGRKKVVIICPEHGDFYQTPEGHLSGRGCKECTFFVSKKETKWLDDLKIPNDSNHRNPTIKIGNRLIRVDGYDASTNTVYEFHGDYWHGNPNVYNKNDINEISKKSFGELYKKTKEKEFLIKSAGFKLITIWECDWDELVKED